jgi:phospholipase/carboxylesterase
MTLSGGSWLEPIRGEILGYKYIYIGSRNSYTLLLLHGTGGSEEDLVPLARAIDPDAGILSPRGKVVENGMHRFFRRLAPGVYDLDDLRYRAEELGDFIEIASHQHGFDRSRLIALGYSNGANIAIATMLLRPGSMAGAILIRPYFPVDLGVKPDLKGKEILITAGEKDPIAPLGSVLELGEKLKALGASVELKVIAADHGIVRSDIETIKTWLPKTYEKIKGKPGKPDPSSLADIY